jgi:hypothetical protein
MVAECPTMNGTCDRSAMKPKGNVKGGDKRRKEGSLRIVHQLRDSTSKQGKCHPLEQKSSNKEQELNLEEKVERSKQKSRR